MGLYTCECNTCSSTSSGLNFTLRGRGKEDRGREGGREEGRGERGGRGGRGNE